MIRTAIIEDNYIALNVFKKMLVNNFPEIEIIGEARNIKDSIKMLEVLKPELLFLDIELPDGSAFNILDNIEYQDFKVVFVTSHDNYAIKAIKFSALDYILKPVIKKDLAEAIERYKKTSENYQDYNLKHRLLKENLQLKKQKVILSTSKELFVVESDDIIRCQSDSFYTNIFLNTGERIFITKTLKEFEIMLSDYGFIRVHNSHLVNIKYIKSYNKSNGGYLILKDNTEIIVSRRRKKILLEVFKMIHL